MRKRLARARIGDVEGLLATAPKQLRAIWGNVTGERMWYALHGYDVEAPASERGMFGHARVLPPDQRSLDGARAITRLLLTKAARRVRRENYYCGSLMLWLRGFDRGWSDEMSLPQVNDDQAVLASLAVLWDRLTSSMPTSIKILRVGITLSDLTPATARQLDLLMADDAERTKWGAICDVTDNLNAKYGRTVASMGLWAPPEGGNVGGKISFTRIPSGEDFW